MKKNLKNTILESYFKELKMKKLGQFTFKMLLMQLTLKIQPLWINFKIKILNFNINLKYMYLYGK